MRSGADTSTDSPHDPYLAEFGSKVTWNEIDVDGVDTFRAFDWKITQEEVQHGNPISWREQNVIFHGWLGRSAGR